MQNIYWFNKKLYSRWPTKREIGFDSYHSPFLSLCSHPFSSLHERTMYCTYTIVFLLLIYHYSSIIIFCFHCAQSVFFYLVISLQVMFDLKYISIFRCIFRRTGYFPSGVYQSFLPLSIPICITFCIFFIMSKN